MPKEGHGVDPSKEFNSFRKFMEPVLMEESDTWVRAQVREMFGVGTRRNLDS
jgi:hypothetical protein